MTLTSSPSIDRSRARSVDAFDWVYPINYNWGGGSDGRKKTSDFLLMQVVASSGDAERRKDFCDVTVFHGT